MTDPSKIYLLAAGSLRAVMPDIIQAYETARLGKERPIHVVADYASAGTLMRQIKGGRKCSVFASADMKNASNVHAESHVGKVFCFAGNAICAVLKEGLTTTPEEILGFLQNNSFCIGTSTPIFDPCGDYTKNILDRAGVCQKRRVYITGGLGKKEKRRNGMSDYAFSLINGAVEVVLLYRTISQKVAQQSKGTIVSLPSELEQPIHYGITAIQPASHEAEDFIEFILSPLAQQMLTAQGFKAAPPSPV